MRYQTLRTAIRNTSRQQAFAFGLLVLLLLLNAGLSYYAVDDLTTREQRIQRTLNFLVALKDTFSALQDAETGQRGYLLTGNEAYLEPYEMALANIDAHLTVLVTLQSELPRQHENISRLIELTEMKRDEMERTVSLSRSDLGSAAMVLERAGTGHLLMQEIRQLVRDMEQIEYLSVSEQRNEAAHSRQQALFAIAVSTFIGLLLMGAVFVLIQRAIARQREDAEKLALTNEELEAIISDRTLAINRYSQELKRSNRELQDFAFVASHDLQEPLRKIRAFGERLKAKFAAQLQDNEGIDYINRMQAAAERMSLLINDLLEFSRVSTRASDFEKISLQAALDDVLDNLSEVIAQKQAQISTELLPELEADPTQMRQLLQNLLSNALKFSREGARPVIRVGAETFTKAEGSEQRQWCRIAIQDNGIGFDPRFTERIFTPFQRLHGRAEYSGSGIGLAVCRRVVERHGGYIRAQSVPAEGTTFWVELPLTQNPALATLAETSDERF